MAADNSSDPTVKWLDAEEQQSWRSFIAGSRRLGSRLDQDLKAEGLSHDDYGVMVALSEADNDRLRMAELAEMSVESRSRLSHHITRLESRGLVERENCPSDRRGTWAILTPAGRSLLEAIAPAHVEGVRRYMLDHLTRDELRVIGEAFARIDAALVAGDRCEND